ncbi:MAG: transcription termination factor Rho [Blastochloris viridis]|uniref:Transcription termination factor Rho n=1 Tax=Blastochloris viridis TaxID=1079 RepID=A0A6N4RCX8_BLAVI|nr:MAG: transcription termination factor Rho [Blastochloris viridis]
MDDVKSQGRRVYRPTGGSLSVKPTGEASGTLGVRAKADEVLDTVAAAVESVEAASEGREPREFKDRGDRNGGRGRPRRDDRNGGGNGGHGDEPREPRAPREGGASVEITHLQQIRDMSNEDIFQLAEEAGVKDPANLRRHELMFRIVERQDRNIVVRGEGCLDIVPDGFGFLRAKENNYTGTPEDIYVSPSLIRRMGLRNGDMIQGIVRHPNPGERYFALVSIESLQDMKPEQVRHRPNFDKLTPLYPTEKFTLEDSNSKDRTGQVIDLVAPIGKGQRCMLVAPPKAGKTMMMKAIAHAIEEKHPEVTLMVLLIDERPEEVTDMERSVKGEVISSTFDEPASRHVQVSEMVIEKAKRLVEMGKDVVILLDSLTRLARAYNTVVPSSGKVLTGGVDANALQKPKRFFGAARKIEQGGSLTIIATALIDTGSRMDEVIFEEFKGTGNSEITLDRKLVEKRTYPAIDISKSGTRHEEMLFSEDELQKVWILRRILQPMGIVESMEFLLDKMKRAKTNADFFRSMNQ